MVNTIILAAGQGIRINKKHKKQFIIINKYPVISYVLKTFDTCERIDKIFLVIPKLYMETCLTQIVKPLKLTHKIIILSGGITRQNSVMNALKLINSNGEIVIIHDGVRPFVTKKLINKCIDKVNITGACVPVIPATQSLKIKKKINDKTYIKTIERKNLWVTQTPQSFEFDLIINAHRWAKKKKYHGTDDSSIVETSGVSIKTVIGENNNIKITTKKDLVLARAIINKKLNIKKQKL